MDWSTCDDYGVMLVVYNPGVGEYATQDDAQEECNRLNFQNGVADEAGDLYTLGAPCPNCGQRSDSQAQQCAHCGTALAAPHE